MASILFRRVSAVQVQGRCRCGTGAVLSGPSIRPSLPEPLLPRNVSATHFVSRRSFFFPERPNNRIKTIDTHPDSIGHKLKPGNLTDKFTERTGTTRTLPVELAYGYFWYIKDIRVVDGKPTISNSFPIPPKNAEPFPELLAGVETLAGTSVELPSFFLRKNRAQDEHAQCTLVAVALRDHGFQMLKSWVDPFRQAFRGQDRVEVVHVHLVEGWFGSKLLKPLIRRQVQNNTADEEHENTLICFRKELDDFRDILRMHNPLAGYVFLLDGVGRVRFAGSGQATEEDVEKVISFANEITPHVQSSKKSDKSSSRRGSSSRFSRGKKKITLK